MILHEKTDAPQAPGKPYRAADGESIPIYATEAIREIEALAAALPESPALMERAGLAAAALARDRLLKGNKGRVLVLAGPGNNGGDAFVVARHLREFWYKVTLVFTGRRDALSADAQRMLDAWRAAGGEILAEIPRNEDWDGIVDGLFGIGLDSSAHRGLEGRYATLVDTVNRLRLPVLALDVPSGLGSDTGQVRGTAIRASLTATFIGLKAGLLTHEGPGHCGEIFVCDLGLDARALKEPESWLLNQARAKRLLPPRRPADSHKGTFGSVGIVGGAPGMRGAAILAGTAALKLGAGRVHLGLVGNPVPGIDTMQPELMLRTVHELFKLDSLSCLVVGPGLGMGADADFWLRCALESSLPLILDADALNLVAARSGLARLLRERAAASILTPHPAEAARLLDTSTAAVQNDRMTAVRTLAQRFRCHAVLKGAGSVCAAPDGKRHVNASGNPGLSTAGTGDVLSGIMGALLAQGLDAEGAMLLAVYLHGAAADMLRTRQGGPVGLTASEIIDAARTLLNRWTYDDRSA
ncbi:NAD(P)H-hydrate dehydratase [Nitrosovibrio sp. Nv17]|uniref:NAD(P)H-hydrate dehydratase n=1 Tax=Nitrosovibrio sp. Nv17 TaxID=1855339 RepID=UPI0009084D87|nr:NAD(P)H-hydrate dehydratase [Nitrosovibrio sp. Nv17]SFW26961.1 yjeF C-terminal region, hydroxyethylthiazole kinase-related/yjeF N-terminal region [Nitrosovibrio sp. Nv17]